MKLCLNGPVLGAAIAIGTQQNEPAGARGAGRDVLHDRKHPLATGYIVFVDQVRRPNELNGF